MSNRLVKSIACVVCPAIFLAGGCANNRNSPLVGLRPALGQPPQVKTSLGQPPPPATNPAPPPLVDEPRNVGLEEMIGKACVVHFRRDALGVAAPGPLAPGTNSLASRLGSANGFLRRVTNEWLVIESAGSTRWIPRAVILEVEFKLPKS